MSERPLILITNDDGYAAKGLRILMECAADYGDVVVMAPDRNASGLSHSFTSGRPLRVNDIERREGVVVYSCDGTPVDCVKLAIEHFCSRKPAVVLSGINHGSNSSVNVLYSGTMGAVIEASTYGFNAIGFSLTDHAKDANFDYCVPYIRQILSTTLANGLPEGVSLNVNFPIGQINGLRVCHEAKAHWADSFEHRVDPYGRSYWWLTGRFISDDDNPDTDERALAEGYASVVPTQPDYTSYEALPLLKKIYGVDR